MTKLSKEEEEFLKLLLEQDWDKDGQAYLKFRTKLPRHLDIQKSRIEHSLEEKGYIIHAHIREYIMQESAKTYFKDKKKNKIKNICIGFCKLVKEIILKIV